MKKRKMSWIEMDDIAGNILNEHLKKEPKNSPLFEISSKKLVN